MPEMPEVLEGDVEETEIIYFELEVPAGLADLTQWWLDTAAEDLLKTLPKAAEYGGSKQGSADLRLIGDNLAELMGWHGVDDGVKQELACWFYAQGKLARLVSDFQQQKGGKPDTWMDATVYTMMARRLQAVGIWP